MTGIYKKRDVTIRYDVYTERYGALCFFILLAVRALSLYRRIIDR